MEPSAVSTFAVGAVFGLVVLLSNVLMWRLPQRYVTRLLVVALGAVALVLPMLVLRDFSPHWLDQVVWTRGYGYATGFLAAAGLHLLFMRGAWRLLVNR
jgi:hypothetical protein